MACEDDRPAASRVLDARRLRCGAASAARLALNDNLRVTIVAALAAGWVALLLLTPWLPVPLAGALYLFGARICHQIAERSWYLDGVQLPVCARCLGIYLGAAVALLLPGRRRLYFRAPRTPASVGAAAMLNVATLVLEWANVWEVSNAVRTGAGAVLGAAVALAVRQALGDPARGGGTVDYERCPSRRRITSAPPELPI